MIPRPQYITMTRRYLSFEGRTLDLGILWTLLWEELGDWRRDVVQTPIPEEQDLRCFFVEWVAAFLPEAVSTELINELQEAAEVCRSAPDYSTSGWYRALPIDVAIFLLTGEEDWLRTARLNVDHHNSSLRYFVMESLALAAHRLTFDPEMTARVLHNLEVRHFRCEDLVILFAACNHHQDYKLQKISEWLGACSHNQDVEGVLRRLAEGLPVPNPFLSHMLWIQQYVSFRLAVRQPHLVEVLSTVDSGPSALPPDSPGSQLHLTEPNRYIEMAWKRMREHPLAASHVWLRRNNPC
jgi:hypothetical protein